MRKCAVCNKTSFMGGTRILLRGHYNPTNWRRKYPNLQTRTLPDGTRGLMCTKCMKTQVKPIRVKKTKTVPKKA